MIAPALLSAVLFLAATPAMVGQTPTGSGLPWLSGVTKPAQAFGAWRGSPVDLRMAFFGRRTWAMLRAGASRRADWPRMGLGLPMLPETHRGQLGRCAAGGFDGHITAIRDGLLANGWRNTFVRLGWEANRVGRSVFPWAALGDGASYRACFRRWVDILNPVTDPATVPPTREQNFQVVWNVANQGTFPHPVAQMYPGDDIVDVVGSQYYDRCPPSRSVAQFEAKLDAHDRWGNPAGPRAWLNFARARGKPWAVPEWGVGGSRTICPTPGRDNPLFMRLFFAFLSANAQDLAFETYFNGSDSTTGTHALYPPGTNPLAAAAYQELWGSAVAP